MRNTDNTKGNFFEGSDRYPIGADSDQITEYNNSINELKGKAS